MTLEETSERPGVEAGIDLDRLQQVFLRLAGHLAPKQRTAFVLREIEGVETAEVARVMNVTESTVRNHLLQARRILKAALLAEHPEWVPEGARPDTTTGGPGSKPDDEIEAKLK